MIYFRVLLLTEYTETTTSQDCTCTLHPSSLSPIMSQKPHKSWILQTPPPWASHRQEIGHSFPPGSWPSRSCLSLLKSHKMKTFTEVSQALPEKENSEPASGMHQPPKLVLGKRHISNLSLKEFVQMRAMGKCTALEKLFPCDCSHAFERKLSS